MTVLLLIYVYFLMGFLIAIWFSFFKITKIDRAATGSSFWFRLIIMPATILIWPVVLRKLSTKKSEIK